jgi:tRNA(fMet)-specific endonuclease VapC
VSLFLLDTDHLSLYQQGNARVLRNVATHINDQLAVSVITVEEQLRGWLTALAKAKDDARREHVYLRMAQTVESLACWTVLPFPLAAMRQHADFIRKYRHVGSNDLKIAAIALEFNATVVTHNRRDFSIIPGLRLDDWAL